MHKQLLGQVYNFNGFNAPQLCSLVVVVEGGQETSKGMHSSKTYLTPAKLQNMTQK